MPNLTGMLFEQQSVDALIKAIYAFEAREDTFRPDVIRTHTAQFSVRKFKSGMQAVIDDELRQRRALPFGDGKLAIGGFQLRDAESATPLH